MSQDLYKRLGFHKQEADPFFHGGPTARRISQQQTDTQLTDSRDSTDSCSQFSAPSAAPDPLQARRQRILCPTEFGERSMPRSGGVSTDVMLKLEGMETAIQTILTVVNKVASHCVQLEEQVAATAQQQQEAQGALERRLRASDKDVAARIATLGLALEEATGSSNETIRRMERSLESTKQQIMQHSSHLATRFRVQRTPNSPPGSLALESSDTDFSLGVGGRAWSRKRKLFMVTPPPPPPPKRAEPALPPLSLREALDNARRAEPSDIWSDW
eukprot:TRINITY_DN1029_c0_g1_i1.p1 TRINITY_DN1029_c0_g1~~TRINITY_DN1029_c0_g1_i1.p1  ORF type:complete len:292 (+),score=78.01 TRINITY_DN1029_c0_g1_i1:59-877(+)